MVGLSAAFGVYNYAFAAHEHAGRTDLPYLKIRNRPYPWACPDCNLFDLECWKECKGGAKADHEEHH